MASRAECGLGAGSVPLACPDAQRLTEGLPGLEGWQVGTKVRLVLDGATGEGQERAIFSGTSPQAWWHTLEWPAAQEDVPVS